MKRKAWRTLLSLLLVALFIAQPVLAAVPPAEPKDPDVILAYKVHCDIGFIGLVSEVVDMYHTEFIDNVLRAIDGTKDDPAGEQYMCILPGWPLKKITEAWPGQTQARKDKIDAAINDGRITVHAFPDTPMLEALDLEDAVRLMTYSSQVSRAYGLELPRAIKLTDVPSQSWLLPTVLSNAGVEFVHMGCNPASTQPDVPPLFWWEGVDGSKVLVMSAYDYANKTPWPNGWDYPVWFDFDVRNESAQPPSAADVKKDVQGIKDAGHTPIIGSMDDYAELILAAVKADPDGLNIPTVRGDMPDTWIHGIASSPTETKMNRNLRVQATELETLNTLLSVWGVGTPDVSAAIASTFENSMLFNEHNWGMNEHVEDYGKKFTNNLKNGTYDRLTSSWKEHDDFANKMDANITPSLKQNAELLAQAVQADQARIVVFNGLAWPRDGGVSVEIPDPAKAPVSLTNVDTGEIVPVSISGNQMSFTAKDVPSLGYATYVFSEEEAQVPTMTVDTTNNVMENEFYKVTLDQESGCVTSILDKKDSNRELVAAGSEFGFGQYFNERFSKTELERYNSAYNTQQGGWAWDDMSKAGIRSDYDDYPYVKDVPTDLSITYEQDDTSVAAVMTAGAAHPVPDEKGIAGNTYDEMSIKVTLHADQPYIDFQWSMDGKVADPWPMADWLSFPFAVENPNYNLYRLGGVMDPTEDIVGKSETNNLCLDGGLTITGSDGKGVGLCSADVPNVSIGKPGGWVFDKEEIDSPDGKKAKFAPEAPTVFLNLYNNQWDTGWSTWNGGDWTSSVRLWSVNETNNETEETSLVTPSREIRLPMTAAYAANTDGTLATKQSGLSVSVPGVHVTAFGPNIDGDGSILRLWEQAGNDVTNCVVTLPAGMNATSVQPVDLRGVNVGAPITVTDNKFTIASIGHNAPYSVRIDYERSESDKFISPITNLTAKRATGGVSLAWKCESKSNVTFVVEQRSGNGEWKEVVRTRNESTQLQVGLGRYQFRVKACKPQSESAYANVELVMDNNVEIGNVSSATKIFGAQALIKTANGDGLSARTPAGTHSNSGEGDGMWLTANNPEGDSVYIQYDFNGAYALGPTYLWNYNQVNTAFPTLANAGLQYVKILYTEDGETWKQFTNEQCADVQPEGYSGMFRFEKGTGEAAMPATNLADGKGVLDFGGLSATAIRFEMPNVVGVGNWGMYVSNDDPEQERNNYGFSEVLFTTEGEYDAGASTLKTLSFAGAALTPAFAPESYVYEATLGGGLSELTVTAVADSPDATVTVNGVETVDGKAVLPAARLNSVNVAVTSKDGSNTTRYNVKLNYSKIITPVEATAVGQEWKGVPAINVINRSGFTMDGEDLSTATHCAADGGTDMYMWGNNPAEYQDGWIQIDLGASYPLDEMWVWNFNQFNKNFEKRLANRGMKQVIISYSEDGTQWTDLSTTQTESQADESGFYTLEKGTSEEMLASNLVGGAPVAFDGLRARYVKITPAGGANVGNYGGHDGTESYYGLSEVAFTSFIPTKQAVSGTVSAGDSGASVEGLTVGIYDKFDTAFLNPFATAETNAAGIYSIADVAPGNYVTCVLPTPGVCGASASEVIAVDDAAVTGADIALQAKALEEMKLYVEPKNTYYSGDKFDPTGLELSLVYNTTDTEILTYAGNEAAFTFEPSLDAALSTTDKTMSITYDDQSCVLNLIVTNRPSDGGVTPPKKEKPEKPAKSATAFSDIKPSDWFVDAVQYVLDTGLMNGTSETAFAPQAKTTRAMVLTMLYRQAGSPKATNSGAWYDDARKWSVDAGISDGSNLTGDISREQLITMLWRAAGSPKADNSKLADFADGAKVSGFAQDATAWAVANGILTGKSQNNLDPLGTATRAETAAMFMRLDKLGQPIVT